MSVIPKSEALGSKRNKGRVVNTTPEEAISIIFSLDVLEANQPNRGRAKKSRRRRRVFILAISSWPKGVIKGINPFISTRAIEKLA